MKKVICILLCLILSISLTACGNSPANESNGSLDPVSDIPDSSSEIQSTVPEAPGSAGNESEAPEGNKTLVVYYSATGSTKAVAETIADTLGADIFEIIPEEPYSSSDLDWTNSDSRVCEEHNDESKRNVPLTKSVPDNWEQYDTVYIGYPIWWGIAAWPINGFIEANDFSEKTVIPFCTSASSGFGSSGELLEEAAASGNWLEGKRFSSNAAKEDINKWLSEISAN